MKTSEMFKKEIGYIVNPTLQKIVIDTLDASPECIQTIPASSSGRYHPSYSLGEGGLARHVKAAVGIAHSLMGSNVFRDMVLGNHADEETLAIYKDVAISALILHDCCKPDDTEKHGTRFNHPLLAANLFKETARKYINNENMVYMRVVVPMIHGAIASHMGKWSTAPYARGVVLPEPKNGLENFVHCCDYLASRKFLIFDFDIYDKEKSKE